MTTDLRKLIYDDRLHRLKLWTHEERQNRADLLEVFKMKSGLSRISMKTFFDLNVDNRMRGHSFKVAKKEVN